MAYTNIDIQANVSESQNGVISLRFSLKVV